MRQRLLSFFVAIFAIWSTGTSLRAQGAVTLEHITNNPALDETNVVPEELFLSLDELARIVDISYCVGNSGIHRPFKCLGRCREFKGFELVKTWNTGPLLSDSCGFLALSHPPHLKRIILAFRGTYSLTNVIVDLTAAPQSYTPYTDDDETGSRHKCVNCTVHAGFMASWHNARQEILPEVSTLMAKYPDYKLVLVGHSLGGAVAALAGLEFALRGWTPHVTTFGEPRIGNAALAAFINERFNLLEDPSDSADGVCAGDESGKGEAKCPTFHRVTHVNDPVPLLPFDEWGYAPHAGEILISKVDVPPAVSDVRFCRGNEDPTCIAGADAEERLRSWEYDLSTASVNERPYSEALRLESHDDPTYQSQRQKSLTGIPSRLQLWELLFAHRDYFWRLGACLPHIDDQGRPGREDEEMPGWRRWWERFKRKIRPWAM
ncbi:hypothetical protein VTO42DRAFT_332 [Malbranchea cinnamomea]